MTKTTQMKIIHLLEEHTDNQRKIALLRYELQHPATITPTEMLEAMSFAKGTGEGKTIGSVSDKTHHIATHYEDAAEELNAELISELAARIFELEQKVERLEFYLKLLPEQERAVIQAIYFQKRSLQGAADDLRASVWSIRKYRDAALVHLCEMYEFIENG